MKKSLTLARALAFVSVAALLAGCKTTSSQEDLTASIPNDYRQRHPIAVREKVQSLTVFIGDGRGTLTPTQRGETLFGIAIEPPEPAPTAAATYSATASISLGLHVSR